MIIFKKWLAGLLLCTLLGTPAFAQGRIATIDLRKAFDGYWKKKEAENSLKDQKADIDKELKGMLDDLKKAKEAYQKLLNDANDQAVSSEERDKRKKLAEDKLKQCKDMEDTAVQYDRTANANLDERRKRVRDNILTEIKSMVNAKAKTAGFSMVLDTAAETINSTPVIIFSNNDNDLTDEILRQLNAGAPTDTSKADDTRKDEKKAEKKK